MKRTRKYGRAVWFGTVVADGDGRLFELDAAPDPPGSINVYVNGLLQEPGTDYTVCGSAVAFVADATPAAGDHVRFHYTRPTKL